MYLGCFQFSGDMAEFQRSLEDLKDEFLDVGRATGDHLVGDAVIDGGCLFVAAAKGGVKFCFRWAGLLPAEGRMVGWAIDY